MRNLIRRFVEVGVPGYHIEDQKPGVKKCGHQGGKVLVPEDEQIKRLSAARFQLDIMQVPGIIVARTDAESATLLDGRSDERDQPFILGATNVEPADASRSAFLAILRRFHRGGIEELSGHALYATSDEEYAVADAWIDRAGLGALLEEALAAYGRSGSVAIDAALDKVFDRFVDVWQAEADVKTYGEAVADVMRFRASEGVAFPMSVAEWLAFAAKRVASTDRREGARDGHPRRLGLRARQDARRLLPGPRRHRVRDRQVARRRALRRRPLDGDEDRRPARRRKFADAIHAAYPDKMLAYNLSPSFNWDTTGMTDEEMRRFPEELGKMGFVFNFITYGGHQIDGLAGGGVRDGAAPGRDARARPPAAEVPPPRVAVPHAADARRRAARGRRPDGDLGAHRHDEGDGQGLDAVPAHDPDRGAAQAARGVAGALAQAPRRSATSSRSRCVRTPRAPSCSSSPRSKPAGEKAANVIFAAIQDRRGRNILSVRDQNTFDPALRRKRLMTLTQLFLIHRYRIDSVHFLTPTEDNHRQTERMKERGIFTAVNQGGRARSSSPT